MAYEYDPWGRVSAVTTPQGRRVGYGYDILGNVTRVESPIGVVSYAYDGARGEVKRVLPNGITTTYNVIPDGRLGGITHARASGELLLALRYTYDAEGRIAAVEEVTPKGHGRRSYEYDRLGRLTRVVAPDGTDVRHTYDAQGNRTGQSEAGVQQVYRHDAFGRLTQAGNATFEHDGLGRLTRRSEGDSSTNYRYDEADRLTEVRSDATRVRYTYDGDGGLVRREAHGQATEYVHDARGPLRHVLGEYGPGRVNEYVIVGAARVGRMGPGGDAAFYLEDHIGSTRLVVDGAGRVKARYAYAPFGRPTLVEGEAENGALFMGEPWDPATGLLHLRAREYDPTLGRFMTPDPLPGSLLDPQTFNAYAYAGNDPVNRTDRTGLQSQPWWRPPTPPPPFPGSRQDQWWRDLIGTMPPPSSTLVRPPQYDLMRGVWTSYGPASYWLDRATPWLQFGANLGLLTVAIIEPSPFMEMSLVALNFGLDLRQGAYRDALLGVSVTVLSRGLVTPGLIKFVDVSDAGLGTVLSGLDLFDPDEVVRWLHRDPMVRSWSSLTDESTRDTLLRSLLPLDDPFDRRNVFFPPPWDGGGGGVPAVGGVYLDQTAKVLGELGSLRGAAYDAESGRLILLGDRDTRLPPLPPAYLAEAIRAVYAGGPHEPGMTIDPDPRNPRGPLMHVIFFGNTRHTRIGRVMFEADRVMKGYSVGRDNLTREPMTSQVPGYSSLAAMGLQDRRPSTGLWSRFWLVPEPVEARVSEDGAALVMTPPSLRVRTETMRWAGGRLVPAGSVRDEHAERFAAHFTQHYDAFAREQPVYAELRHVAACVALAKWMRARGVPVDANLLRHLAEGAPPTPDLTPAAQELLERRATLGLATRIERVHVFGGVEMTPELSARRDASVDQLARTLRDARRAASEAGAFTVSVEGRAHPALSLPLVAPRQPGGFTTADDDVGCGLDGPWPALRRYYSSLHNERSELGRSWSLLVPRLEFEAAGEPGRLEYLSVEGVADTRVLVQHFTLTDAFGLSHERFEKSFVDQEWRRIGFAPKAAASPFRGLYPEGDNLYRLVWRRGPQALFDRDGRLRAVLTVGAKALYEYDNEGRLTEVRLGEAGLERRLTFSRDEQGRIAGCESGPERVSYAYDERGDLVEARRRGGVRRYRYDERHLLTATAGDGAAARALSYDDFGRLAIGADADARRQKDATIVHAVRGDGSPSVRKYDEHLRLVQEELADGHAARYSYGRSGVLERAEVAFPTGTLRIDLAESQRVEVRDALDHVWHSEFAANGTLSRVSLDGRIVATLTHAAHGVARVEYAGGARDEYVRDSAGRVREMRRVVPGLEADSVRLDYDAAGRVTALAHPALGRVETLREAGRVTRRVAASETHVELDSSGRPIAARTADGAQVRVTYGTNGSAESVAITSAQGTRRIEREADAGVVVHAPSGGVTRYRADAAGRLAGIVDAEGTTATYTYDASGRLVRLSLPGGACLDYVYDTAGRVIASHRGPCSRAQ